MKKLITLFTFSSVFAFVIKAQYVENFESFPLSGTGYNNDASPDPGFFGEASLFENNYDTIYNSWSGFAISNHTDVSTPGWMNQYSAFPGSGYNSDQYGVYYPFLGEGIDLSMWGAELQSMRITNTTYAALSMRDGDGYGKVFGDSLNADGVADGTNGEDYFKVWIIASYVDMTKDSIEFYLADYRFADDSLDYIIDTWEEIDLTSLDGVALRLDFRFESSDTNEYGIRTPTYFAMDDLTFYPPIGVSEIEMQLNTYPNPVTHTLNINSSGGELEIETMTGELIYFNEIGETHQVDFSHLPYGIYMVKLSNEHGTSVRKVVK